MTERHGALLSELAELGMNVARDLQGRVASAEDDASAQGLALAFQRTARAVRQTLALEAKLARDAQAEAEAAAAQGQAQVRQRVDVRRRQVRYHLAQEIFREFDADESEAFAWLEALDLELDEAALDGGFLDQPVERCIAPIRAGLGLPANDVGPPDGGRRSSG